LPEGKITLASTIKFLRHGVFPWNITSSGVGSERGKKKGGDAKPYHEKKEASEGAKDWQLGSRTCRGSANLKGGGHSNAEQKGQT